jgi:outer membrane protein TolC
MKKTMKLCLGAGVCSLLAACSSTTDFLNEPASFSQELDNVRTSVQVEPGNEQAMADEAGGPLQLRLAEAVRMAIENNPAFRVSAFEPALQRTREDTARAAFDPSLTGEVSHALTRSESTTEGEAEEDATEHDTSARIGLQQSLPTGTTLDFEVEQSVSDDHGSDSDSDSDSTTYDLTIFQALLQGRGNEVNLAALRQAQLETRISQYELQAVSESLVSQVENAYWDLVLAKQSIAIYERSLAIAEQQADEIKERIRLGAVANTELAAAKAETAVRRESLIDAQSTFDKAKLQLLRLLHPKGADPWMREVEPLDAPGVDATPLTGVTPHVTAGLEQRPDLQQALLEVKKGELEVVRTRNGLLPKLDLFVRLGNSSYAYSYTDDDDEDGDELTWTAGLQLEVALGRRAEKAEHRYAQLSLEQTRQALANMKALIQLDIRTAYVEVKRASEQIKASSATRELREEVMRTELEKFRVGESTALLVSQARRDLVTSRIAEVEAVIAYRKALLELHRVDGSLLARRGITVQSPDAG